MAVGLLVLACSRAAGAEAASEATWLTGHALDSRLSMVVPRAFWSAMPLRKVLHTISTTQGVAILVDRRVDRDRTVDLTLSDVTVAELLQEIAKDHDLGLTRLGPVTYVGPRAVTARLRNLALLRQDDVARLPTTAARAFRLSEPLVWSDLATPRELLRRLAESAGLTLRGLEQVPHDLWAAADLPAVSLVDRFTLVAVQFDLTFRIAADGRSLDLLPIPERLAVARRSPDAKDFPRSEDRAGTAQRSAKRTSPKRSSATGEEMRFTVQNAKGPMDRLIQELAQKLQLEVRLERDALEQAGIAPNQIVSFSVKDATMDDLFEAVLSPAGCTFRREGKVIVVVPAER